MVVVTMAVTPGFAEIVVLAAAVGAPVVVEVALAVVPCMGDATAGVILGAFDAGTLAEGQLSVGAGAILHALDVRLVPFQAGGFARGQCAGARSMFDAAFLGGLALVDGGRGVPVAAAILGKDGQGHGGRQGGGQGEGEQATGFHLAIS